MKSLLAILAVVFMSAAARADDYVVPKQTVVGAEKSIPLGEEVDLSLSPVGDLPKYLVSSSEEWAVYELDHDPKTGLIVRKDHKFRQYVDPNGTKGIFFGAGIKDRQMLAVVTVTYLYAVKDDKGQVTKAATRTVVMMADLVIGTGKPRPVVPPAPPKPKPDPTPPVLPAGQFGLAKFIYDEVKADRPGNAAVVSAQIAGAYRKVIAEAGGKDLKTLLKASATATTGMGADDAGWTRVADAIQNKLYALYATDHKLNTGDDLVLALGELATGFEAIK
jgi:hypothetical protein